MSLDKILDTILNASRDHNWKLLGAILLIGLVQLVRGYGAKLLPALGKGKVAFAVAICLGAAWSVASAVVAGAPLGTNAVAHLLLEGATTGLAAAGLYSGGKKLKEKADAATTNP